MESLNVQYIFLSVSIVAVVRLVDLIKDKNYASALKIVLAAVVGGICGYFGIQGLDVVTGIQTGLTASGLVTGIEVATRKI